MVKVFIKSNPKTPTGYELVDGDVITPIVKIVDDGKTLALPTNSSNRKYWSIDKVKKGEVELSFKETRTLGTKANEPTPTPKVNRLEEDAKAYLSEDEYETFKKLIGKIEYNRQVKSLEAQIKALEEQKAKLMEGGDK